MGRTTFMDHLPFGFHPADFLFRCEGAESAEPEWPAGEVVPTADLRLSPGAAVLSYGAGIIEGLKAERAADGRILLFRPAAYGARFARSARRLLLQPFPEERFVAAVSSLAAANEAALPAAGTGSLYLRPMEHAIEPVLGYRRVGRFAVTIYASPVGELRPADSEGGIRLKVLPICRAAPGGTGAAKAIANYAGALFYRDAAQREGFDDVLYLDAKETRFVQETSGANFFCQLRDGTLVTPPADDTVLAGITRDSVLTLARSIGIAAEERPVAIEEVLAEGEEAFCTGTAWTVQPIAELQHGDRRRRFERHELAAVLRSELRQIQAGARADPFGWTTALTA